MGNLQNCSVSLSVSLCGMAGQPGLQSLAAFHCLVISAIMMMTQDCLATSLNLPGCQDLLTYWQAGTQAGPAGPVTVSGPGRARCASGTVAVTRRGTAARRRHASGS